MGRNAPSRASTVSFAKLEPQIHRVSEAVIKKKWKKLSTSSQENVRDMLTSLKKQSNNEKDRGKLKGPVVDTFVEEVASRLVDRLPRMPFPPTNSDENFDFELTLHRVHNLEQQLTNNINSMSMLRAQIKKEERLLEADRKEVGQLQDSLRSNDALRRQQSKNLHSLAQNLITSRSKRKDSVIAEVGGNITGGDNLPVTQLMQDDSALPVLQQLRSHMDSMHGNTLNMLPVMDYIEQLNSSLSIVIPRVIEQSQNSATADITAT